MKKKIISAFMAALVLMLSACGSMEEKSADINAGGQQENTLQDSMESDNGAESTASGLPETEDGGTEDNKKVLVAYFAYSENIGDISGMDVDAITSASLNAHTDNAEGNLQVMAQEAVAVKDGDLFSIIVTEPYDPDYNTMVETAQDDQRDGKQFTFVNEVSDLSQYDVVYIGVPVWWGSLPQPAVSFFEAYDFSGKTIIPFGIHLGSRFGSIINEIKELEPDADVRDGFTISADTDNEKVRTEFNEFLNGND